jgi:uncharacterized heparinase superfamily protein
MTPLIRKLLTADPGELRFRLERELAVQWRRLGYRHRGNGQKGAVHPRRLCRYASENGVQNGSPASWWLHHMQHRTEPRFLLDGSQLQGCIELYPTLFPSEAKRVVSAADDVCRGNFSLLGVACQLPGAIRWQDDPATGQPWPRTFYRDLNPADVGVDPKHVWELNRHEFLIDCGKAYRLTGNPVYAGRVFEIIDSWVEQNPYLQGINWVSALEVAVRAISWLTTYQLCRTWQNIPADSHYKLISSLYLHGSYLYRNLSFYSSPYNHLVGESTALYLLGCFFPEFDESAAWRRTAWDVLTSQIGQQFHSDGGNVEQATFYHHYCLGFYLLAVLTRLRRGEAVPSSMQHRLEQAFEFSMWLTRPDGTVPRIGDCDNARSIRLSNPPLWDFRNLLCLGATLFARGDMKSVAGPFSEDAFWLLGKPGVDRYTQLEPTDPSAGSRLFARSGYFVSRTGWGQSDHFVCFDCGELAAGLHRTDVPSAAHGHADLLSVELSMFGQPLLIDGGSYTYHDLVGWQRHFRESQAHNTIRVDGASQAKYAGNLKWSCVAKPEGLQSQSFDQFDFVECSHSGFHGLNEQVRHRRALLVKKDALTVVFDRLEGTGEHDVEVFFHLAPGNVWLHTLHQAVEYQANGVTFWLQLVEDRGFQMELLEGGLGPEGGWIGTAYGRRQRAPVIRYHGRVRLPVQLTFACLGFRERPDDLRVEPQTIEDDLNHSLVDGSACRISRGGKTDILGIVWNTPGEKRIGELSFMDRVFVRSDVATEPVSA